MAQNVTIAGASYTDVTAIEVPKTTSGVASFHDVTDTTATASDVAQGKYFYTAAGVKTVGEALPATITETLDSNGGYVLEVTGGLDLSNDTVTADRLLSGYTAHDRSGTAITGTLTTSAPIEEKDVNFYDYDGTLLYSYTNSEFSGLTAMPANPSHTGLTAQGWNWSLADAKEYVASYGMLDIGQNYVTNDGKTRLYITLDDTSLLALTLQIAVNGTVVVNWGDNTSNSTITGTSLTTLTYTNHTYSELGDYIITISVSSGSFEFYSTASSSSSAPPLVQQGSQAGVPQGDFVLTTKRMASTITRIEIGTGPTKINSNVFRFCSSLKTITVPTSISFIGSNCFYYCSSLLCFVFPKAESTYAVNEYAFYYCLSLERAIFSKSITQMTNYAFSSCFKLKRIAIPNALTTIGQNAFYNDVHLRSVILPDSVTRIDPYAFYYAYSLEYVRMPQSVTFYGQSTFYGCMSLTTVTDFFTTDIPANTFGLTKLRSFVVPNNTVSINGGAFQNCHELTYLTIGPSVTGILNGFTFSGCYNLKEIHFKPSVPPTVNNSGAFTGIPYSCKIYVPTGSRSAYISATNYPSSSYYTYIEE